MFTKVAQFAIVFCILVFAMPGVASAAITYEGNPATVYETQSTNLPTYQGIYRTPTYSTGGPVKRLITSGCWLNIQSGFTMIPSLKSVHAVMQNYNNVNRSNYVIRTGNGNYDMGGNTGTVNYQYRMLLMNGVGEGKTRPITIKWTPR